MNLQERFSALALIHIHNEMDLNSPRSINEIIDLLAIRYPKRLKMINIMEDDDDENENKDRGNSNENYIVKEEAGTSR